MPHKAVSVLLGGGAVVSITAGNPAGAACLAALAVRVCRRHMSRR